MSVATLYNTAIRNSLCIVRAIATVLIDTWLEAFMNKPSQNMNPYVRWELFIVGCVFLAVTINIQAQLNWLVLLPLLSVYLIQAAVVGYEPVYYLLQRLGSYLSKHSLIQKLQSLLDRRTAIAR